MHKDLKRYHEQWKNIETSVRIDRQVSNGKSNNSRDGFFGTQKGEIMHESEPLIHNLSKVGKSW